MKKLILLFIPFLLAAAPSRIHTYPSGEKIQSSQVTANEDAIFNYLNSGVDSIADLTIVNADVNGSANIQCGKLNLTACSQAITTTSGLTATGLVASVSIQGPFYANDGTVGYTGSCASSTTLTVKNGIITGCN